MRLETIDRGAELTVAERTRAARALLAALDRYQGRIDLVRLRFAPDDLHGLVRCKARVWCGPGPTLVASSVRPTVREAVDATAEVLQRAVRRRLERGETRSRAPRAGARKGARS